MDHGPDVGVGEEIDNVVLAGFDIYFDFGEARDIRKRLAVVRVLVLCGRHQALARQRRHRRLGELVHVFGRLVAIVDATQLNRMLGGLRQAHARVRRLCGRRARSRLRNPRACRRESWPRFPEVSFLPPFATACAARVIAWVVWLPPDTQVQGRSFAVLPQTMSHFSQGTPSISALTR